LDQAPQLFSEQAVRRNLIIISDFQESDWQTAYSESGNQGIMHQLIKVGDPDGVGGKRPNNLSVLEGRAGSCRSRQDKSMGSDFETGMM
jgi:hypothetical protein